MSTPDGTAMVADLSDPADLARVVQRVAPADVSMLAETPLQVQVVCPGYTKTEFHMTTGGDPIEGTAPDDQPELAMLPQEVVQASLAGLDAGEVLCVPGLGDPSAIDELLAAEAAVRSALWQPLADRYHGPRRTVDGRT